MRLKKTMLVQHKHEAISIECPQGGFGNAASRMRHRVVVSEGVKDGFAPISEGVKIGFASLTEGVRNGFVPIIEGVRNGSAPISEGVRTGFAPISEIPRAWQGQRNGDLRLLLYNKSSYVLSYLLCMVRAVSKRNSAQVHNNGTLRSPMTASKAIQPVSGLRWTSGTDSLCFWPVI